MPGEAILNRLAVRFPDGMPDLRTLDPGLTLLLFVDDPSEPRARVRLTDLVRQRGERPLNLRRGAGQAVLIVLIDPSAPGSRAALGWNWPWAGDRVRSVARGFVASERTLSPIGVRLADKELIGDDPGRVTRADLMDLGD